jgi:hypothetical protein
LKRIAMVLMGAALVAVAMMGSAGPVFGSHGGSHGIDKGRAASVEGLGTALQQTSGDEPLGGFAKVKIEYERAQDPLTPGVAPGGGGFEP